MGLRKRSVIAALYETTEGQFTNPSDANDVLFLVYDVSYKPTPRIIPRNMVGPSFARKGPQTVADKLVTINFTTEFMGGGALGTEPKWARFLKACGLSTTVVGSTSVTYDPTVPTSLAYDNTGANGNTTLSLEVFQDGVVKRARGCRGTFTLHGEAGGPAFVDWEFTGVYESVADVAYPSLSTGFDNLVPPIIQSAAFSFHGLTDTTILFKTISLELGNSIVPRWSGNDLSGIRSIIINDRVTTFTTDPEQATKAAWTTEATERLMAGTAGAFTITIGTTNGNKATFSAPAALAQIVEVDDQDRDQLHTNNLKFEFLNAMLETAPDIRFVIT